MVEVISTQYLLAYRLLRFLAYIVAGGTIAQAISCLTPTFLIQDSQAAGMIGHFVTQHLAYYFLAFSFVILSVANIMIKRGAYPLRNVRLPSLLLILAVSATSFLLIPRMDYLRETALLDGMPVMLSPFANYFQVLNVLVVLLLFIQVVTSTLVAWRLGGHGLAQMGSHRRN